MKGFFLLHLVLSPKTESQSYFRSFYKNTLKIYRNKIALYRNYLSFYRNKISFYRNFLGFYRKTSSSTLNGAKPLTMHAKGSTFTSLGVEVNGYLYVDKGLEGNGEQYFWLPVNLLKPVGNK